MWPFVRRARSRDEEIPAAPGLLERLSTLETSFRALARDLDDLDESFRSFRGRRTKREALDRADAPPELPEPGQPMAASGGASVHALKAAGKWPYSR